MIRNIICLLLAIAAGTAVAQDLHIQGRVVFANRPDLDSGCLVSFPFTVNRDDFQFMADSTGKHWYAGVFAELSVRDTAGHDVKSQNWYFVVKVKSRDESSVKGYKVFNRFVTVLRPGRYSARLTAIDAISKRQGVLVFDTVEVPAPSTGLRIGGAILAYRVDDVGDSVDEQTARLVDNGYLVLPNPLGVFSINDSMCHVYAEVYGLTFDAGRPTQYRLSYDILDPNDQLVKQFGFAQKKTSGPTQVLADDLGIGDLARGGYWLRIVVNDLAVDSADTVKLPLWRIESEADLHPPLSAYDSLSPELRVAILRKVLSPAEVKILDALTPEGKANYVEQYWNEHDANSTSGVSRDQLLQRYQLANTYFSTNMSKDDGWKTERGRILLKYGPWEDRTQQSHPNEGQPYEIWHYRTHNPSLYFIFVDVHGIDDYRMVHSNAKGERYDQTWEDYFKEVLFQYR